METATCLHLSVIKYTTMKKIGMSLMILLTLLSFNNVQDVTITGTVTSTEDNSPIPGVNVALKGTSTATSTDVNGKYSIKVPAGNCTLIFSFIGFVSQEIKVQNTQVINVMLAPDVTELQEVVVIGYSTTEKRSVTGAVTLQGKTSGVTQSGKDRESVV